MLPGAHTHTVPVEFAVECIDEPIDAGGNQGAYDHVLGTLYVELHHDRNPGIVKSPEDIGERMMGTTTFGSCSFGTLSL